jgi:hypothetical protein
MARLPAVPTAIPDLERRRLLYVLSEALERVSRLRQILKRQQTFLRAEQAEDRSANAIEALTDNLDKHCQMILGNSDRIVSLLDGKALIGPARAAVEQSLAISSTVHFKYTSSCSCCRERPHTRRRRPFCEIVSEVS